MSNDNGTAAGRAARRVLHALFGHPARVTVERKGRYHARCDRCR